MPFINVRITRDGVTKDQHLTHIVIEEVDTDNWGYAGITTTEYRQSLVEPR